MRHSTESKLDTRTTRIAEQTRGVAHFNRERQATIMVTIALAAVTFVMMSPTLWTLMAATKPTRVAFADPPQFIYEPTLSAFGRLWENTQFIHYVSNTVVIGLMTVVATLAIAAPAAYALARYGRSVSAAVLALALLFRAIPGFAIALPFYKIATTFGIYDTRIALVIAFVAVDQPFTIWLLRNFFAAIPPELEEAAMIDGCSRWGAFLRVILPVTTPGLITAGMLTFLIAFQSYLLPVVLTSINATTVPVFLATQIGQSLPQLQQAAAGVVLLTLPVIVLAFVAQRYLVAGLTSGALKG